MLDLDHFKALNDRHGHQAGDEVLEALGAALRHGVRASDFAGRWGGEEFVVLLPDTDLEGALQAAETMRASFDGLKVPGVIAHVTASLGVATLPDHAADGPSLIRAADRALYRAKAAGRNCVVAAGGDGGARRLERRADRFGQPRGTGRDGLIEVGDGGDGVAVASSMPVEAVHPKYTPSWPATTGAAATRVIDARRGRSRPRRPNRLVRRSSAASIDALTSSPPNSASVKRARSSALLAIPPSPQIGPSASVGTRPRGDREQVDRAPAAATGAASPGRVPATDRADENPGSPSGPAIWASSSVS